MGAASKAHTCLWLAAECIHSPLPGCCCCARLALRIMVSSYVYMRMHVVRLMPHMLSLSCLLPNCPATDGAAAQADAGRPDLTV